MLDLADEFVELHSHPSLPHRLVHIQHARARWFVQALAASSSGCASTRAERNEQNRWQATSGGSLVTGTLGHDRLHRR
jgi:hypothetical protein